MIGGRAQVLVFDRLGAALLGTFAGNDLQASNGKGLDRQVLTFTAQAQEPDYDPALFDDALAVVQIDMGAGWVDVGTPYLLANPSGTASARGEGAARNAQVRGVGALALLGELPILQRSLDDFETETGKKINRRGPKVLYYGWMHPQFNSSGWDLVTVVTGGSLAADAPKKGKPKHWGDSERNWIYLPDGTGGLTLFVGGTFTVTAARKYLCRGTADEEFKIYLFGPGWGGVFLEATAQEDGFNQLNENAEVLQPGVFHWCAEMTTIDSAGGDGFDALMAFFATVDDDGEPDMVVSRTDDTWVAWRQDKDDPRPGLTFGHMVRLMMASAQTWMPGTSSEILTRTFTDDDDSGGVAWADGFERSYPIGTPLTTVLAQSGDEVDAMVDVDWGFNLWQDRGTDHTADVIITPGSPDRDPAENLGSHTWSALSPTASRAIVDTEDGLVVHVAVDEGDEGEITPRAVYLEAGELNSVGEGKRLGQRHVARNKHVNVTPTMEILGVPDAIPGRDFSWGDTVTGRGRYSGEKAVRIVSWALRQGSAPPIWWTLEKDEG